MIGRQVAIHVEDHQFQRGILVLQMAEQEWQREEKVPDSLDQVTIEDLDLKQSWVNALRAEPDLKTAADLVALSDAELPELELIGVTAVSRIKAACSRWLTKIRESQLAP